jgi:hypothetical protein
LALIDAKKPNLWLSTHVPACCIQEDKMPQQERRLLRRADVIALLQLEEEKISWLISTEQLRSIRICDEERFDSRDVFQLIEAYKSVQARKQ